MKIKSQWNSTRFTFSVTIVLIGTLVWFVSDNKKFADWWYFATAMSFIYNMFEKINQFKNGGKE